MPHLASFTIAIIMLLSSIASAAAEEVVCLDFDTWIWAQNLYDSDPDEYAHLDPDSNGIACEEITINGFAPVLWTTEIPDTAVSVTLDGVIDGNTINVVFPDGTTDTVRLLGINAPEFAPTIPGAEAQCGGTIASDFLTWILSYAADATIWLEPDESARDKDDRQLAYVWFTIADDPNAYMANYSMLLSGWAESKNHKPDEKYKEEFSEAKEFSVNHVTGVRLLCGKFGLPESNAGPSEEQIIQAWENQPNQGQLPAYPGTIQVAAPTAIPAPIEVQAPAPVPTQPSVPVPAPTSVPVSTPTQVPVPTAVPTEAPVSTAVPTEVPVPTSVPTEPAEPDEGQVSNPPNDPEPASTTQSEPEHAAPDAATDSAQD